MKAIILSAGEGSRMRPLTLTKPKTMLPVAGKPIIQYNIESLRNNGITDILLIVRYKEEMVRNYFGDGRDFGVNITYKTQKDFLGTANAISYGEDFIDESIIVLNGDIILDDEIIGEIIEKYNEEKPDTLMVLTEVEDPSAFGVVEIENGYIKNIVEKPVQWSLNAAIGAEVHFTPFLGLYVEPGVGYFFNDGSSISTIYKERPFNFNFEFGLRFTFR